MTEEKKIGRPTKYSDEVAGAICMLIAGTVESDPPMSMAKICSSEKMPDKATVYRWLEKYPEFRDQYARAREQQADYLADEIVDIADGANNMEYQVSRLRIDARKWKSSKLAPKKYGDKQEIELPNPVTIVISKEDASIL